MQVEEELARLSPHRDMLLTIGVFDGVHLGHQYLLSRLTEQARAQKLLSGVVTFRPHPQEVVAGTKLPLLTDLEERSRLLQGQGVDAVITLSFTAELAQLSARHFVSLLLRHLRMRGLVIGPDFALGRGREGNIDTLRQLGREMNFSVTVVSPFTINGDVVSSTAIRQALAGGDIATVVRLTGRPYRLQGRVVAGAGRGIGLGFPTANLDLDQGRALPVDGVYASWAYVQGNAHPSLTNIGSCPTFGGGKRAIEVYLLDYRGDLYGGDLAIEIVERLRDEVKFSSAEELKRQIAEDVERGRVILATRSQS